MTCTFFGHRFVPREIEPILKSTLLDLIENQEVNLFYVGNHGGFDGMVYRELKDLAKKYDIRYYVVLAYVPSRTNPHFQADLSHTLLPDGIETAPKRLAISFRNNWMIAHSDYVITYVTNPVGSGAAQFKLSAERKGKVIINLSS